MSTETNTELLNAAAFYADYWEGTMLSKLIREDVQWHDMETLAAHIKEARDLAYEQEYNPGGLEANDVY